ncbi:hypothetical protein NC652_023028 [Populus alba x Populus x berolinensis]|nr:hypothetical protein NC652_023028 [Populus alba x Populus x berolinensis]
MEAVKMGIQTRVRVHNSCGPI